MKTAFFSTKSYDRMYFDRANRECGHDITYFEARLTRDTLKLAEELFFENKTFEILTDDVFARLTTFPNVVITGHQAYFTQEAVAHIAETTLENITAYENGADLVNAVVPE